MKHPCDLVRCGCVKNFLLNHPGWCKPENSHVTKKLPKKGCYRTLQEIAVWGGLADADKLVIWQRIEARQLIELVDAGHVAYVAQNEGVEVLARPRPAAATPRPTPTSPSTAGPNRRWRTRSRFAPAS